MGTTRTVYTKRPAYATDQHGNPLDHTSEPKADTFEAILRTGHRPSEQEVFGGLQAGTLGYIVEIPINADGEPTKPRDHGYANVTTGIPRESDTVGHRYQALDLNRAPLDGPTPTREEAMALVVGAAHSQDPAPEHVVPVNRGGRPAKGLDRPISWAPRDGQTAGIDAYAARRGVSRAEALRTLVARGLDTPGEV